MGYQYYLWWRRCFTNCQTIINMKYIGIKEKHIFNKQNNQICDNQTCIGINKDIKMKHIIRINVSVCPYMWFMIFIVLFFNVASNLCLIRCLISTLILFIGGYHCHQYRWLHSLKMYWINKNTTKLMKEVRLQKLQWWRI